MTTYTRNTDVNNTQDDTIYNVITILFIGIIFFVIFFLYSESNAETLQPISAKPINAEQKHQQVYSLF